jgi:serine/threonine-protein kinase RsbW
MIQLDSAIAPLTAASSAVELQVPAEVDQLAVVRTVAEAVTARADFDLDAVADIKLAVDEASACLIGRATLGARLDCRYHLLPDALEVIVSTTTCTSDVPNRHGFGWHVLTTLTDEITVERLSAFPGSSSCITSMITLIRFTKTRRVGQR